MIVLHKEAYDTPTRFNKNVDAIVVNTIVINEKLVNCKERGTIEEVEKRMLLVKWCWEWVMINIRCILRQILIVMQLYPTDYPLLYITKKSTEN